VKHHHKVRTFGSNTASTSQPAVLTLGFHAAPQLQSDTLTRTISTVCISVTEDPSGNFPPVEWFESSRVIFAAFWDPTATHVMPSSENSAGLLGRVQLYPKLWYPRGANALYGVSFFPQADTIQFRARHKGNGVQFPAVVFGLYLHDSFGVLQNLGGLYSTTTTLTHYDTSLWESDM